MRILYSHRIQSRDGQSVHVEELISAFLQEGHEVRVVGPSFYDQSGFGGESRMVARLRRLLPGALGEVAELAYNVPAYLKLRRICADFKPDLIYERYNLFFMVGTWLSRRSGIPLFLEVNSPLAEERTKFNALRLRGIAHRLERLVWRSAARVFAVTDVLRGMIVASGVEPQRVIVVPNGVVLNRFAGERLPRKDDAVVLGFVGFVRAWHGLDSVIDAMATQPGGERLRLSVVGDGPVRPDLEAQARRLGIADRVTFSGVVDHALVPRTVMEFDIALQPKVVAYASPLKIFDYMAAGRAIVAPDQPNIREILTDGETALLVDPNSPDGVWAAIAKLAGDAALRARLGGAARAALVERDYTWRGNARRIAATAAEAAGR